MSASLDSPLVLAALALVAFLYSAVGHGGASGYIAVLALAGVDGPGLRPLVLVLNLLVALLTTVQFARAGHFRADVVLPLALVSVPAAFVGGSVALPMVWLQRLLAVVLLVASWRLATSPKVPRALDRCREALPGPAEIVWSGGVLGLLAGLTGTGGGIFLTPWMILRHWLQPRQAAAVSAAFIVVNSAAGLLGLQLMQRSAALPALPLLVPLAATVIGAAGLGSQCGSRWFPPQAIRRLLALVLLVASVKLLGLAQPPR